MPTMWIFKHLLKYPHYPSCLTCHFWKVSNEKFLADIRSKAPVTISSDENSIENCEIRRKHCLKQSYELAAEKVMLQKEQVKTDLEIKF